jgi:hypothetical protein
MFSSFSKSGIIVLYRERVEVYIILSADKRHGPRLRGNRKSFLSTNGMFGKSFFVRALRTSRKVYQVPKYTSLSVSCVVGVASSGGYTTPLPRIGVSVGDPAASGRTIGRTASRRECIEPGRRRDRGRSIEIWMPQNFGAGCRWRR